MTSYKFAVLLLVFIPIGYSLADAVVYETDFQSPPEDWYIGNQWTFGVDGAVAYRDDDPAWDDVFFTHINGDMIDCIYFIPDGTDSLLIEIPYYIHVNNSDVSGGAIFEITAYIDESPSTQIFYQDVWQAGVYEYEGTVEYLFNREGPGWLGFFIEFYGGCEMGCGINALWEIHGITVTAYGEDLYLDPFTWASIKSTYRFPSDY